jgi:hypothetical protein
VLVLIAFMLGALFGFGLFDWLTRQGWTIYTRRQR